MLDCVCCLVVVAWMRAFVFVSCCGCGVCLFVSVCVVVWLVCCDAVWTLLLLAAAVGCVGARVWDYGD
jgi:hypothetical protein